MKHKCLILLLCISNTVLAQLQSGKNILTVDGQEVWVYTPVNYDATATYPVVFELHGMGQTKDNIDDQGVVNEQQYIAVYPEGTYIALIGGSIWNTWSETNVVTGGVNHVTFLTNVYNGVKAQIGTSFNSDKVYVYGYSNGGAMALKMIEETNLFKGAVIRSMTLESGHVIPSSSSKVPMLFIHGIKDKTVPYKGGGSVTYPLYTPTFMDVKTAVRKWAVHNGTVPQAMDVHYLATASRPEFWFREYRNTVVNAPVYLYAIPNGSHTTEGFTNRNIKRSAIKLFKKPQCYGLGRGSVNCK